MDLKKAKETWFNIPPEQRNGLEERYKEKVKQILAIYTEDLSEWIAQDDSEEGIAEFIHNWVENSLKPE